MGNTYKDNNDFIKTNKLKEDDRKPRKEKGRKKSNLRQEINEQMIEDGLYGI